MTINTDISKSNNILSLYKGGICEVSMYSPTHRRLLLRLTHPNISEAVFLVGVSCLYISGNFVWNNADLTIKVAKNQFEIITTILDERVDFKLVTDGGFALVQGFSSEFGDTFENFISPNSPSIVK